MHKWNIAPAHIQRRAREDERIRGLEQQLEAAYLARAGQIVNEYGHAWCASCGARRVMCDTTKTRRPVQNRIAEACSFCTPDAMDFSALRRWRALPADERAEDARTPGAAFVRFAKAYGAKGIRETFIDAAAVQRRAEAANSAHRAIEGREMLHSIDEEILLLVGDTDLVMRARARGRTP